MSPNLRAEPDNFLSEEFDADPLHPADIESILIAAYDRFQELPKYQPMRKQYKSKYNTLVDCLTEKRNFQQFSYL